MLTLIVLDQSIPMWQTLSDLRRQKNLALLGERPGDAVIKSRLVHAEKDSAVTRSSQEVRLGSPPVVPLF